MILVLSILQVPAQDLDPRAYLRVPVKTTTAIAGFVYSYGGVVTDPTLPIKNIKADVQATSLGVAHSRPPWLCRMERLIESPMPIPPAFVV